MDKQAELNEFAEDVKSLSSREKAALVVVSLGSDRASQIYKYLSEQEIEELTYAVAGMGKADNKQVEDTLDEFYKFCLAHKMMTDGGMEYARDVLEKAFGSTAAAGLLDKVSRTLQSRPFSFFMKGDPKALLSILQNERPQVIALILAYMDSMQAAQVLEELPDEKRIQTVESMARIARLAQLDGGLVLPVMKTVAISILTKITAEICKSSGEGGIAAFVETAGTALALAVAAPLAEGVLELMAEMLL